MTYASSESGSVLMSKFIPASAPERGSLALRSLRGSLELRERLADGGGVRVVGSDLEEPLVGGDRPVEVVGALGGAGPLEQCGRLARGALCSVGGLPVERLGFRVRAGDL